jgi:hypothetical protein
MRQLLLVVLFLPLIAGQEWQDSRPGGFSAKAVLSSSDLRVSDSLEMTLNLSCPEGFHLDIHSVREALAAAHEGLTVECEEIGCEVYDTQGHMVQEVRYRLEPWAEGEWMIAFLPLRWVSEWGEAVELHSAPLSVHVSVNECSIRPDDLVSGLLPLEIKPQIQLSRENRQQLAAGAALEKQRREQLRRKREIPWYGLAALLLIAALVWSGSRLKPLFNRKDRIRNGWTDPRRYALGLLRQLEEERLPDQGLFDPFYVQLTRIVRQYIEQRFELKAPEQTTQEFLSELVHQSHFDSSMQQLLSHFLMEADLVKFAKVEPSFDECRGAIDAARKVIEYRAQVS